MILAAYGDQAQRRTQLVPLSQNSFFITLHTVERVFLQLLHFGIPLTAHDVPPAAALCLAALHGSPGLAAVLAPGCSLRVTSTLYDIYDNLCGAALFGAPCSAKERLVLGLSLELLELSLDGVSDEARGCPPSALAQTDRFAVIYVSLQAKLQALYKQVGLLLPNVQAFYMLSLWATLVTEGAKAEDQSRLAPRYDLRFRCIVFLFSLFRYFLCAYVFISLIIPITS
ncbi:hypothetical protein EDB89DRAFT_2177245 [Lactarius sanguifluus]|nr:hypothetical protein EDB89DRAFT_2177245 [Lactarius sanguifluus]